MIWRSINYAAQCACLITSAALLTATVALAAQVRGQKLNSEAPLHLQADRWTYDDLKHENILTGRVIVTQGTLTLQGERVVIRHDQAGYYTVSSFASTSALASFRQKYSTFETIEGFAEQIDYDSKSKVALFSRRAHVRRLKEAPTPAADLVVDEVTGDVIRYDAKNALYTAETTDRSTHGKRVRAILSPHTLQPSAVTTDAAAKAQ
jgi:lipopolysaccharide export system protein LptA